MIAAGLQLDRLARRQRPDGSWASEYRDGAETSPAAESNHAGYLAVGVWHSWLLTRDSGLVAGLWPAVRRGLDAATKRTILDTALGIDEAAAARVMPANYTGWEAATPASYAAIEAAGRALGRIGGGG